MLEVKDPGLTIVQEGCHRKDVTGGISQEGCHRQGCQKHSTVYTFSFVKR